MEAVVMAAGEGRRLRPLTERWAKPALPVDGRPIVATLLHELAAAGLERVWVVVGHLREQVEALVGDGSAFGVEVRIVHQPEAIGSADTVLRSLAAGARPPLVVTAADTVYTAGDVGRFADAFRASGAAAALAGRRDPPPGPGRQPIGVENGRLTAIGEGGPLSAAPLWGFAEAGAGYLAGLPGPPFELAEGLRRALAAGETVAAVEIRRTRDITAPADLAAQNFAYLAGLPAPGP